MNLKDAIASGRPFTRPGHHLYMEMHGDELHWLIPQAQRTVAVQLGPTIDDLCTEDLVAEDWELQPETIEITFNQLAEFLNSKTKANSIWKHLRGLSDKDN